MGDIMTSSRSHIMKGCNRNNEVKICKMIQDDDILVKYAAKSYIKLKG